MNWKNKYYININFNYSPSNFANQTRSNFIDSQPKTRSTLDRNDRQSAWLDTVRNVRTLLIFFVSCRASSSSKTNHFCFSSRCNVPSYCIGFGLRKNGFAVLLCKRIECGRTLWEFRGNSFSFSAFGNAPFLAADAIPLFFNPSFERVHAYSATISSKIERKKAALVFSLAQQMERIR